MVDCKICGHPLCSYAGVQRGIVINCANYMPRQKPQTNADRIRAMSDEDLATFLSEWAERCLAWYGEYGETLNWLKQPVKDGEGE